MKSKYNLEMTADKEQSLDQVIEIQTTRCERRVKSVNLAGVCGDYYVAVMFDDGFMIGIERDGYAHS